MREQRVKRSCPLSSCSPCQSCPDRSQRAGSLGTEWLEDMGRDVGGHLGARHRALPLGPGDGCACQPWPVLAGPLPLQHGKENPTQSASPSILAGLGVGSKMGTNVAESMGFWGSPEQIYEGLWGSRVPSLGHTEAACRPGPVSLSAWLCSASPRG